MPIVRLNSRHNWLLPPLAVGQEDNAKQLARLARCMETGEWVAPEQLTITELEMPKWLQYQ